MTNLPDEISTNQISDELLPAARVRAALGNISDMTLWRWLRAGRLPEPVTIGRRRYWKKSTFTRWMDDLDRKSA